MSWISYFVNGRMNKVALLFGCLPSCDEFKIWIIFRVLNDLVQLINESFVYDGGNEVVTLLNITNLELGKLLLGGLLEFGQADFSTYTREHAEHS